MDNESNDPLADFHEHLTDGAPLRELIPIIEDAELVGHKVIILDGDMDPISINIDCDGYLEIETEGYDYISLCVDDLTFLAKMARRARKIMR